MNFFDIPDEKEYKYKILVYPNITYKRELEKDSYIIVLDNVIRVVNELRNDIHWTLILPYVPSFINRYKNVDILIYDFPSYPNAMRTHFDFDKLMKLIDWKNNDYDIVYSHLPEHTLQLSNLFHNNTNIKPKIIGYCHWFEVDENTGYEKRMLMHNIAGILEMEEMGVNSSWLKNHILDKVRNIYSEDILDKIATIIQPHYLGVDNIDLTESDVIKNSIIFNHRPNEYTGFNWFVDAMDELYSKRQNFNVYFTLADVDKPWANRIKLNSRKEYLDFIKKMKVGVGTFTKYSAWSISTTDGLSNGVPYILPNKLVYPEMVGKDYPLLYNTKDEFIELVNKVLDDGVKYTKSKEWIISNIHGFLWNNRVSKWFNNWNVFDDLQTAKETESYEKIVTFIKDKKVVTKNDILEYMGWGVRIPFTSYRNLLRTNKNIKFTKGGYEWIMK